MLKALPVVGLVMTPHRRETDEPKSMRAVIQQIIVSLIVAGFLAGVGGYIGGRIALAEHAEQIRSLNAIISHLTALQTENRARLNSHIDNYDRHSNGRTR